MLVSKIETGKIIAAMAISEGYYYRLAQREEVERIYLEAEEKVKELGVYTHLLLPLQMMLGLETEPTLTRNKWLQDKKHIVEQITTYTSKIG